MSTLLPDQKVHDLAVAFAAAEYNNEVERRQIELEAAQQGISIFLFLYEQRGVAVQVEG